VLEGPLVAGVLGGPLLEDELVVGQFVGARP